MANQSLKEKYTLTCIANNTNYLYVRDVFSVALYAYGHSLELYLSVLNALRAPYVENVGLIADSRFLEDTLTMLFIEGNLGIEISNAEMEMATFSLSRTIHQALTHHVLPEAVNESIESLWFNTTAGDRTICRPAALALLNKARNVLLTLDQALESVPFIESHQFVTHHESLLCKSIESMYGLLDSKGLISTQDLREVGLGKYCCNAGLNTGESILLSDMSLQIVIDNSDSSETSVAEFHASMVSLSNLNARRLSDQTIHRE